mgnify:FL=1
MVGGSAVVGAGFWVVDAAVVVARGWVVGTVVAVVGEVLVDVVTQLVVVDANVVVASLVATGAAARADGSPPPVEHAVASTNRAPSSHPDLLAPITLPFMPRSPDPTSSTQVRDPRQRTNV